MMRTPAADRNVALALGLMTVAAGMVGMAYAAVPLYRLFCEATGYGGTTQRAEREADRTLQREIIVHFDANVAGLPWSFRPEISQLRVRLGETTIVNFIAENTGSHPIVGTATFNVQPNVAGIHFNKIQCFCFTEQTLAAGERVEMPVQFFIAPELAEDRDLEALRSLTLSYTFFLAERGQPVAQADGDEGGKSL